MQQYYYNANFSILQKSQSNLVRSLLHVRTYALINRAWSLLVLQAMIALY